MDVIPIEVPALRRVQQSTIGGMIVLLAGVVAVVGSHRTVVVPEERGVHVEPPGSLWALTRGLGENGDVQAVRGLAMVLIAIGLVVLWAGRRGRLAPITALTAGVVLAFVSVQWWRFIRRFRPLQLPDGYRVGYTVGDGVYVVGAAGLIAIVGAAIIWASPKSLPVERYEYPGRAVV